MNEQNDILKGLHSNPFKMPEGYLESLESELQMRINPQEEEHKGWRAVLRPALYMAAMFGLIFGMGYGVMSLTNTAKNSPVEISSSGIAEIEQGFLSSSFIDFYDEDSEFAENTELDSEDIFAYLDSELSFNQLTSYLDE